MCVEDFISFFVVVVLNNSLLKQIGINTAN